MNRVGLMGFGKAGKAVARVLSSAPDVDLRWIAKRSSDPVPPEEGVSAPVIGLDSHALSDWLELTIHREGKEHFVRFVEGGRVEAPLVTRGPSP